MLIGHGPDTDLLRVLNIPYTLEVLFFLFEFSLVKIFLNVIVMSMGGRLKYMSIGIIICHLSVSQ